MDLYKIEHSFNVSIIDSRSDTWLRFEKSCQKIKKGIPSVYLNYSVLQFIYTILQLNRFLYDYCWGFVTLWVDNNQLSNTLFCFIPSTVPFKISSTALWVWTLSLGTVLVLKVGIMTERYWQPILYTVTLRHPFRLFHVTQFFVSCSLFIE